MNESDLGGMDNPYTHALTDGKKELQGKWVKCYKCLGEFVCTPRSDIFTQGETGGAGQPLICYGCLLTSWRPDAGT